MTSAAINMIKQTCSFVTGCKEKVELNISDVVFRLTQPSYCLLFFPKSEVVLFCDRVRERGRERERERDNAHCVTLIVKQARTYVVS